MAAEEPTVTHDADGNHGTEFQAILSKPQKRHQRALPSPGPAANIGPPSWNHTCGYTRPRRPRACQSAHCDSGRFYRAHSADCQLWQRERRLATIKASAPTYLAHREAQAALRGSPSGTGGPQLKQPTVKSYAAAVGGPSKLQDAPEDQDFLGLVSAAAQAATIQSRVPEHHPVPDLHHVKLRAARRRAERRYPKAQDPTLFNRVDVVCRRHDNRRRRQSWQGICHSLSQARGGAKTWRLLRSIVIGPTVRQPVLAVAIHLGISEQELAERLADHFTALPYCGHHHHACSQATARPPRCLDCQPDCSSVSGAHFRIVL
ncbi:hypothetical protein MTO96_017076 [Rhipicephalus appendiculatus]